MLPQQKLNNVKVLLVLRPSSNPWVANDIGQMIHKLFSPTVEKAEWMSQRFRGFSLLDTHAR